MQMAFLWESSRHSCRNAAPLMLRKTLLRTSQQSLVLILSLHQIISLPHWFHPFRVFSLTALCTHYYILANWWTHNLCDHFGSVWRGVHIVQLFIKEFSPAFCYLRAPRSRCSQHLVFKLCFFFCLRVIDHVSHPYKTTGKIIVVRMLTVKFFQLR